MKNDLFRSAHDLDFRSHFKHDLLRSNYGCICIDCIVFTFKSDPHSKCVAITAFDASRQETHDAGIINVVPLLSKKKVIAFFFAKTAIFGVFALWRPTR